MITSDPLDTLERRRRQQRTAERRNVARELAKPKRAEFAGLHHGKTHRVTKAEVHRWGGKAKPGDVQPIHVQTASWLNQVPPRRLRWVKTESRNPKKGVPARYELLG